MAVFCLLHQGPSCLPRHISKVTHSHLSDQLTLLYHFLFSLLMETWAQRKLSFIIRNQEQGDGKWQLTCHSIQENQRVEGMVEDWGLILACPISRGSCCSGPTHSHPVILGVMLPSWIRPSESPDRT